MVFTLVPLSVFLTWSLARSVKLNWTGPLWLGMIPFIAYEMVSRVNLKTRRPLSFMRHAWPATIVTAVFVYSATLYYLTLGFPGISYPANLSLLGWQDLAQHIEQIEDEIEARTGVEPLVVAMDKNKTASGLAFYRNKFLEEIRDDSENEGVLNTLGGRHLFGGNSLMYGYWFPKERLRNRDMILVARKPDILASPRVLSIFRKTGPVQKVILKKDGMQVGPYYYVFAEGYQAS
jgi:dolichol-phosphate mannosyltransferase